MKIREINVAQGEWLAKQEAALNAIEHLNKQMTDLLNEHSYVDETKAFPGDGKQLMQTLWNQMTSLKGEVGKLADEVKEKRV